VFEVGVESLLEEALELVVIGLDLRL